MKKKVLFIINSLRCGGTEKTLYLIIKNINSKLIQPVILTYNTNGELLNNYKKLGFPIVNLKKYSLYNIKSILFAHRLYKIILHYKIDVLFIFSTYWIHFVEVFVGKIMGIKSIYSTRRDLIGNMIDKNHLIINSLSNILVNNIVCNSLSILKNVQKSELFCNNKLIVIYNGRENFNNIRLFKNIRYYKKCFRIICIANFLPIKRHDIIIKAIRKIEEMTDNKFSVTFIGEGPTKKSIIKMIKEYRIRNKMIFLGFQSDVSRYLLNSDVLILTSDFEGSPGVIIEAYSAGIPVIVTDNPGSKELVLNGKTGFTFNKRNPSKLAEYIIKLMNNYKLINELSNNAYKYYLKYFTIEKMINKYSKLILK